MAPSDEEVAAVLMRVINVAAANDNKLTWFDIPELLREQGYELINTEELELLRDNQSG